MDPGGARARDPCLAVFHTTQSDWQSVCATQCQRVPTNRWTHFARLGIVLAGMLVLNAIWLLFPLSGSFSTNVPDDNNKGNRVVYLVWMVFYWTWAFLAHTALFNYIVPKCPWRFLLYSFLAFYFTIGVFILAAVLIPGAQSNLFFSIPVIFCVGVPILTIFFHIRSACIMVRRCLTKVLEERSMDREIQLVRGYASDDGDESLPKEPRQTKVLPTNIEEAQPGLVVGREGDNGVILQCPCIRGLAPSLAPFAEMGPRHDPSLGWALFSSMWFGIGLAMYFFMQVFVYAFTRIHTRHKVITMLMTLALFLSRTVFRAVWVGISRKIHRTDVELLTEFMGASLFYYYYRNLFIEVSDWATFFIFIFVGLLFEQIYGPVRLTSHFYHFWNSVFCPMLSFLPRMPPSYEEFTRQIYISLYLTNVVEVFSAVAFITQLPIVRFNWNKQFFPSLTELDNHAFVLLEIRYLVALFLEFVIDWADGYVIKHKLKLEHRMQVRRVLSRWTILGLFLLFGTHFMHDVYFSLIDIER